jgi:peptide/nickel transport system substrate-binding protein
MTRIIRSVTAAAVTLLLVVAGTGAGSAYTTKTAVKYNTTGMFKLNLDTDPGSVSPYKNTSGTARHVFAFGYDTLVSQTRTGKTVPYLAEKWTVKPSEVTYTLRKGIKCDDGTYLKASDVAADFKYIMSPTTLSPWLNLTVPVKYSVSSNDKARTISIKTVKPFGLLMRGAGSLAIVCPSGLKDETSIHNKFSGTGAYQVTEYVAGDHYTMQKHVGYNWGPNGATTKDMPKTLKISFVANESTSAGEFITGQVNAVQLTGPDRARVEAMRGVTKVDSTAVVAELDLNEAPGRVLADVAVRKALAASLDRYNVTAIATLGRGSVENNLFAETPGFCPGDVTKGVFPVYDVGAAMKLLDGAGWLMGGDGIRTKNGQPLTVTAIYRPNSPQIAAAMEYIAQQWKNIGVKTNLVAQTNSAFGAVMYGTLDYDVAYSGLNFEMPFMETPYHSGATPKQNGRNSGSTVNTAYDSLTSKALAAPGDACAIWNASAKALLKAVDMIPLSVGNRPFYVRGGTLTAVGIFTIPTSYRLFK